MSSRNAAVPAVLPRAGWVLALGAVTVTNCCTGCAQLLSHTPWQVFSPVSPEWMSEASKKAP